MAQLAQTVKRKPKLVVRETGVHVELLLSSNSNFQLVFCSGVCNYLPIVNAAKEWPVGDGRSKIVVGLV